MTLGDKLSRLRKENNYTQEQLADILGVSRQAISKWESDVAYPETDKLIRLSALYRCSLDYLIKDEVETPDATYAQQQGSYVSTKASKLFKGILRFAPTVLYALWALLLWAFYAAPFIKLSDNNLYQWFGKSVVEELQPTVNALISLGVISGVYIIPLGILQRCANKRVNFIANLCSFALQIGVFVCVMCLIGVCKSIGLESGKVVVVTASLSGVFAVLQAVFLALDGYFNHEETEMKSTKPNSDARKIVAFVRKRKVPTIVVSVVLLVIVALSIVLPIVLPRTVLSPFNINKVSRIQLGDSRDDVIAILGKPLDVDTEKLAEIIGNDEADAISKKNVYYYCSPKAERFIKSLLRMLDKVDNLNSSPNVDDAQIILAQLNNMMKYLNDMEFQYIEVYFENGKVSCVEYDSNFSLEREDDLKWDYRYNTKQKIVLTPNKIPIGQTPYTTNLYAQVFYVDGSYRLSKVENLFASGDAVKGWKLDWYDHWGNYTFNVLSAAMPGAPTEPEDPTDPTDPELPQDGQYEVGEEVERGEAGNGVSYVVAEANGNGKSGYVLIFQGSGEMDESDSGYPWHKYRYEVLEVRISNGVTNVPKLAFMDCKNLTEVTLPNSLQTIGLSAFHGCESITGITVPEGVTKIEIAAFWECTALRNIDLPSTLSTLEASAFYGCSALQAVTLPTGLKTIGPDAFNGCKDLRSINIPTTVNYVGYRAFENCPNLNTVIMGNFNWRVESMSGAYDVVNIQVGYNAAQQFTDTYCYYEWYLID